MNRPDFLFVKYSNYIYICMYNAVYTYVYMDCPWTEGKLVLINKNTCYLDGFLCACFSVLFMIYV